jgi:hypothetical protein
VPASNALALPVFVDIDAQSYNLNPELVERAITGRTRAILPVHFGGNIADMTREMLRSSSRAAMHSFFSKKRRSSMAGVTGASPATCARRSRK